MSYQMWFAYMLACWVISVSPGCWCNCFNVERTELWFSAWLLECAGSATGVTGTDCSGCGRRGSFVCDNPMGIFSGEMVWCWLFIVFGYFAMESTCTDLSKLNMNWRENREGKLVLHGFLVNITNPKAIVFLLAVLPQFLDLSKPQWIQYLIMAATMVTIDLIVMAGYTGLAAKVLRLLKSPKQQKVMNRTFAGLFAGAAFLLSLVHQ